MNWGVARLTLYIVSCFGLLAALLASMGLGTYDPNTGMFDPHPIDVRLVAGYIAPIIATGVAAVANWFGWGSGGKKNEL